MDQLVRYDRRFEVASEGERRRRWRRRAQAGRLWSSNRSFAKALKATITKPLIRFVLLDQEHSHSIVSRHRDMTFPLKTLFRTGNWFGECTATTAYAFETCQLELGTSALRRVRDGGLPYSIPFKDLVSKICPRGCGIN